MPPRYSYWTIIAGGLPTAFRAAERDELMPTFTRIREKHPDAEMKWFARGKLWESPDAARRELGARRERDERSQAPRADRRRARDGTPRGDERSAPRPSDWRPGGEHRDPRQKYKDAKKAKNLQHRRDKFARKQGAGEARGGRPADRAWSRNGPPPPRSDRFRPGGDVRARTERPRQDVLERDWRERPPQGNRGRAPHGNRPPSARRDWEPPREEGRTRHAPPGPRPDRWDKPGAPPHAGRDRARPPQGGRPPAPRRDWERPREEGRTRHEPGGRQRPDDGRGRPGAPHGGADRARPSDRDRGFKRPFEPRGFERNQGTEEPPAPPRPRGPNREPRPSESPAPTPPPRPSEPAEPPPAPPERGRLNTNKHRRRRP